MAPMSNDKLLRVLQKWLRYYYDPVSKTFFPDVQVLDSFALDSNERKMIIKWLEGHYE